MVIFFTIHPPEEREERLTAYTHDNGSSKAEVVEVEPLLSGLSRSRYVATRDAAVGDQMLDLALLVHVAWKDSVETQN